MLRDLLIRAFGAAGVFTIRLSLVLAAKQPSLHPSLPSPVPLLLQAVAPTAGRLELPKNRLPPEGGAHVPRNTGQGASQTCSASGQRLETRGRPPETLRAKPAGAGLPPRRGTHFGGVTNLQGSSPGCRAVYFLLRVYTLMDFLMNRALQL